jgi:16S rRNA (guanine527-N7)-methyltransferase
VSARAAHAPGAALPHRLDHGLAAGLAALRAGNAGHRALPDGAEAKLAAYVAVLAKWNHTYNLTAIRGPARMVTHHVLDALAVLPYLPADEGLHVLDVGSGGGLPGIPLAIARPDWHVAMIDSSEKRTAFVRQAAIELPLPNAEAITGRVEDYTPREPFQIVISRAFADLSTFAAAGARHLAPSGRLYAMKGGYPAEEIAQLPPGIALVAAHPLTVPGLDARRHLIVLAVERAP